MEVRGSRRHSKTFWASQMGSFSGPRGRRGCCRFQARPDGAPVLLVAAICPSIHRTQNRKFKGPACHDKTNTMTQRARLAYLAMHVHLLPHLLANFRGLSSHFICAIYHFELVFGILKFATRLLSSSFLISFFKDKIYFSSSFD